MPHLHLSPLYKLLSTTTPTGELHCFQKMKWPEGEQFADLGEMQGKMCDYAVLDSESVIQKRMIIHLSCCAVYVPLGWTRCSAEVLQMQILMNIRTVPKRLKPRYVGLDFLASATRRRTVDLHRSAGASASTQSDTHGTIAAVYNRS